jgi:acetoin utilization protein AcuB
MAETVAAVMTVPVETVGVADPLQVALERMSARGCRELPVVENGRLVGMLTERDLRSALAGDAAAALARPVSFAMSPEVWSLPATTPLSRACARLAEAQVGAMPVLDAGGALCGILSVTDLLRAAALRFQRDGD